MSIDDVQALRTRLAIGIADARRALATSGGDVEEAYVLLRDEGIAALVRRTGADSAAAAATFDEVAGDLERAAVRLNFRFGPTPKSACARVLDEEGASDESRAGDLAALIGGFDGDDSPRDTVYLCVELFTQTGADGLESFVDAIGADDLGLVVSALQRVGAADVAELMHEVATRAKDDSAEERLKALGNQIAGHEDAVYRKVVAYARSHVDELD